MTSLNKQSETTTNEYDDAYPLWDGTDYTENAKEDMNNTELIARLLKRNENGSLSEITEEDQQASADAIEALEAEVERLKKEYDDYKKAGAIAADWWLTVNAENVQLQAQLAAAQGQSHNTVAGALYDFMGWLTTREERLVLSSHDLAGPAADAIRDFAKLRNLSLENPNIETWVAAPIPQQPAEPAQAVPKLTVWFNAMPESNGKRNWTVMLCPVVDGQPDLVDGYTVMRSEYHGRTNYAADYMRWLIGERKERPCPTEYDDKSQEPAAPQPKEKQ